ncbi:hypothetical protein BJ742DRAFT_172345 [Cladochytrium replicatum]|nr:hypothetical protein BJ742DRAFT_172345 [Cladochytrium replicatum]
MKSLSNCKRRKLAVQHPEVRPTDIYVRRKSNRHALIKRAKTLIDSPGFKSLDIHGLGAALVMAMELALKLKEIYGDTIEWNITTSSVELHDEVEDDPEVDVQMQTRINSAIHIKVARALK